MNAKSMLILKIPEYHMHKMQSKQIIGLLH